MEFDAIYTAQDIGSYKPDPANFRYLLARLAERGVAPGKILHTAQSLFHDHAPAKRLGLASAWIDRRHDRAGGGARRHHATGSLDGVAYDFRFESLGAMAEAHARENCRAPPAWTRGREVAITNPSLSKLFYQRNLSIGTITEAR